MKRKIEWLKAYKEVLLLYKKLQIINKIDQKIENKIPTYCEGKKIKPGIKDDKVSVLIIMSGYAPFTNKLVTKKQ